MGWSMSTGSTGSRKASESGERVGSRRQSIVALKGKPFHSVMASDSVDEIERMLLPVVAAAPGYMRLRYWEDGAAVWVERMPVVAWRIDSDRALPVTPEQDEDAVLVSGVLLPDGRVVMPGLQTFADEGAWRAAMDEQAKAHKPKSAG